MHTQVVKEISHKDYDLDYQSFTRYLELEATQGAEAMWTAYFSNLKIGQVIRKGDIGVLRVER